MAIIIDNNNIIIVLVIIDNVLSLYCLGHGRIEVNRTIINVYRVL